MKVEDTQHWMVIADNAGTNTHFGDKIIALTRQDEIKSHIMSLDCQSDRQNDGHQGHLETQTYHAGVLVFYYEITESEKQKTLNKLELNNCKEIRVDERNFF
jgi:hypothetical protein